MSYKKKNIHSNFVDLNPMWAASKQKRVKALANKWLDRIKIDLKERVKQEKLRQFKEGINRVGGVHKMSFDEIKALSTTFKRETLNVVLQKDKETND